MSETYELRVESGIGVGSVIRIFRIAASEWQAVKRGQ